LIIPLCADYFNHTLRQAGGYGEAGFFYDDDGGEYGG